MLVLVLDIGSSSTRTALFDTRGRAITGTDSRREYSLRYRPDGAAELSAPALLRAVRACLNETVSKAGSKRRIVAVGGSAFWHGLLGLGRNRRPVTPIFTWADSRSARDAAQLRREFDERKIHRQTGCMVSASFWPAKLRWLRRTDRELFRKVHRWISPVDWVFSEIFGATGTSHSMASATGLYDLETKNWASELCDACGVDPEFLDAVCSNPQPTRFRNGEVLNPIGDGAAGNLGSGATGPGQIAINLGTSGAARMVVRGRRSVPFGLFRYAVDRERCVIGGAISNAGNLHQWCLRQLRLNATEAKALSRRAAADDPLTVLPFLVSERAPTWPENLRGSIAGLSQSTDAAEILRATTCGSYYRLADILELLERQSGRAKQIIVSGGILHSKPSLRLLADALGRDIGVSAQAEASLRGAAVYALEKLGYEPAPLPKPALIRHNRTLAAKHRIRRERQNVLERMFSPPEGRASARP